MNSSWWGGREELEGGETAIWEVEINMQPKSCEKILFKCSSKAKNLKKKKNL